MVEGADVCETFRVIMISLYSKFVLHLKKKVTSKNMFFVHFKIPTP